jgi:hypothetical protein
LNNAPELIAWQRQPERIAGGEDLRWRNGMDFLKGNAYPEGKPYLLRLSSNACRLTCRLLVQ